MSGLQTALKNAKEPHLPTKKLSKKLKETIQNVVLKVSEEDGKSQKVKYYISSFRI